MEIKNLLKERDFIELKSGEFVKIIDKSINIYIRTNVDDNTIVEGYYGDFFVNTGYETDKLDEHAIDTITHSIIDSVNSHIHRQRIKKCIPVVFPSVDEFPSTDEIMIVTTKIREFLDTIVTNSKRVYVSAKQAVDIADVCGFVAYPASEHTSDPYLIGIYKNSLEVYVAPNIVWTDKNCYVEK